MSAPQEKRAGALALYWALVRQDLQLRVLGSALGLLWLVLQPLLYLSFTTVVFYFVLGVRFGDGALGSYLVSLLAGLVAWLGMNEGIGKAAPTLLERANLIRNFPVPRLLVPLVRDYQKPESASIRPAVPGFSRWRPCERVRENELELFQGVKYSVISRMTVQNDSAGRPDGSRSDQKFAATGQRGVDYRFGCRGTAAASSCGGPRVLQD